MSQTSNALYPRRSHEGHENVLDEQYYYAQMRPLIRDSLSFEQETEVKQVLKRAIKVPSKKLMDIEVTFWFFKRFYFVFYLGLDKRKTLHFSDALQHKKLIQWLLNSFISVLLWSATLFVLFFVAYYFKSTIGIDLMPEQHANELFQQQLDSLP